MDDQPAGIPPACACNPGYVGAGDYYCPCDKALKSRREVERCDKRPQENDDG